MSFVRKVRRIDLTKVGARQISREVTRRIAREINRRGDPGDRATGGDPADLVPIVLGEPEVAIQSPWIIPRARPGMRESCT